LPEAGYKGRIKIIDLRNAAAIDLNDGLTRAEGLCISEPAKTPNDHDGGHL
jgi:hypothetical protein